jgi:hypothetical protein
VARKAPFRFVLTVKFRRSGDMLATRSADMTHKFAPEGKGNVRQEVSKLAYACVAYENI